jgi:hypothetical protein
MDRTIKYQKMKLKQLTRLRASLDALLISCHIQKEDSNMNEDLNLKLMDLGLKSIEFEFESIEHTQKSLKKVIELKNSMQNSKNRKEFKGGISTLNEAEFLLNEIINALKQSNNM